MLQPHNMSDRKVGVLGLGRSGMAAANALCAAQAQVFLHDDQTTPERIPAGSQITRWQDWPWQDLDMMVISPGIPHAHPAPHPAAAMASENGVPVVSEVEIAMRAEPRARIIAITGTNGKSTVTALIGHCLKRAGYDVAVGGNIGDAACGLDDPGPDGVIVLELSSYQLETTPSLRADCAIILNITPDHLDRHGGFEGYCRAKARILDALPSAGLAVIGSGNAAIDAIAQSACHSHIHRIEPADAPEAHRDCPALVGTHNAENAAAAQAALVFVGMSEADISVGMTSFTGLPHRMQPVAHCGAVTFVNDSKATNGVAAAKSLSSFANIYWIAGGLAKEDGLGDAAEALANVNKAYLIGAAAPAFATALNGRVPAQIMNTIDHATHAAYADAAKDSGISGQDATILLAPAAASFDQFPSFVDRGNAFAAIARKIAATPRHTGGAHA